MNTEKITNQNVTGLWPIPLVRTSIDPVGDDVMDFLINQDTRPKTEGIAQNSYNAFVLNDPICKDLKEALEFKLQSFFFDFLGIDQKHYFYINTSWTNKYEKGDYSNQHWHTNSLWQGLLFLTDVGDTGSTNFMNDKNWYNLWPGDTVRFDYNPGADLNVFNTEGWAIAPKKWELVFFPSFMSHGVSLNQTNEIRRTLAFSVWTKGKFGDEGAQLTI